jgi:hypothetical protein
VILVGKGFRIEEQEFPVLGIDPSKLPPVVKPYMIGKDVVQRLKRWYVIDFHGLSELEAQRLYPALYQRVHDTVRPRRLQNRDAQRQRNWWLFGRSNDRMRAGLAGLSRYIATVETSKFKPFVFLDGPVLPDHKLYVIACDDAAILAVLSSRIHQTWALAAGGHLGVGNDPTWTNTTCFLPFPFPSTTHVTVRRIRELGESLDAHRKRQQAAHPDLTLTGMYNVLEKLRRDEALNPAEKVIHAQGLVSVLKQIHDDLDATVFATYGWPLELTDEQILERLVKLNAERAEEERTGTIRWLRPAFQNPSGQHAATQAELAGTAQSEQDPAAATATQTWPKRLPEQIAAVRDLLLGQESVWTAKQVAKQFKGSNLRELELVLESLAALGLLVAFQPNGELQWKPAMAAV